MPHGFVIWSGKKKKKRGEPNLKDLGFALCVCNFQEASSWQQFRSTFGYEGQSSSVCSGIAFSL